MTEAPFEHPVQGHYAGVLSSEATESWKHDR
jgi:hypothetical protein